MAGFTRWVSLVSEPATKLQRRHRYGAQVGFDFFTQAPVRLRQMQQAQGCGLVVGYLLPLAMVLRVGQLAQVEPFVDLLIHALAMGGSFAGQIRFHGFSYAQVELDAFVA